MSLSWKFTITFTNLLGSILILSSIAMSFLVVISILNDLNIKPSIVGQLLVFLGTLITEGVALMGYRKYIGTKK